MEEKNFKLNAVPSPPSEKDYKIKLPKVFKSVDPVLPSYVDLSPNCTSIKNQGQIGACTAFASVGLMEYIHRTCEGSAAQDLFSEKFTYYSTRVDVLRWDPNSDSGAYLRSAAASLAKFGASPEPLCPYDGSYNDKPPAQAYESAAENQALSYARIKEYENEDKKEQTLQACRLSLAEGKPFTGGFICFENIWSGKRGYIPLPEGKQVGGHAVLFVGYNDETKCFKFKNSWGEAWGDQGYGYLPYNFLLQGHMWDLWTITKIEDFSDVKTLELKKPKKEEDKIEGDKKDKMDLILEKLDTILQKMEK